MDDLSRPRKRGVQTWARVLAASELRSAVDAPDEVIEMWVDAAAVLVEAEHRQAALVLLRNVGLPGRQAPLDVAAAAWRALVTGHRRTPATGLAAVVRRPAWAAYATTLGAGGPAYFVREVFDLAETRGQDRPHVSVDVAQFDRSSPSVLVEVSASGTPTVIEPEEARLVGLALNEAAAITDQARAGQSTGRRRRRGAEGEE